MCNKYKSKETKLSLCSTIQYQKRRRKKKSMNNVDKWEEKKSKNEKTELSL